MHLFLRKWAAAEMHWVEVSVIVSKPAGAPRFCKEEGHGPPWLLATVLPPTYTKYHKYQRNREIHGRVIVIST